MTDRCLADLQMDFYHHKPISNIHWPSRVWPSSAPACLHVLPVHPKVHGHGEGDGGEGAACHGRGQECNKVPLIEMTNTIVYPGAVVIHLNNTMATPPAMMRAWCLVPLAGVAALQVV